MKFVVGALSVLALLSSPVFAKASKKAPTEASCKKKKGHTWNSDTSMCDKAGKTAAAPKAEKHAEPATETAPDAGAAGGEGLE